MIHKAKTHQSRDRFSKSIEFPQDLPISQHVSAIEKAVQNNQVVIVVGETGSGKTTQLPKICLQLDRGQEKAIIHTQPRRLAARGIAQRLQHELGVENSVGLRVRFDDRTSEQNYVQVMTDGVLLNLLAIDPLLRKFDTVIIDEAHERSLNIDFLLGLMKKVLEKRPEFRLIITSATIKHYLFSEYFKDAPVFSVSGRTFPVTIHYLDSELSGHAQHDPDPKTAGIIEAVAQIYKLHDRFRLPKPDTELQNLNTGHFSAQDTLIFLPGERQINDAAKALKKIFNDFFDVLPLYARLTGSDQSKVFHPGNKTRIVLATNLAETSITVPRIGYVIDTGLVRTSRYSQRRKVQLLPIEPISKASAQQRAGRCGRIAPGTCVRLYSEDDFNLRPEYPEAEIHRTHLAGVILQMKAMKLADPADFPFIEPPAQKLVNDGYQLLEELGAVQNRHLTAIGKSMSRFPLDPRLARMILAAGDGLYEILIIASAMSVMDVVEMPRDAKDHIKQKHRQFQSKKSDFISKVLLWHRLEWFRRHLTRKEFQHYCEQHYISLARFYEWRDIHKQLLSLVRAEFSKPKQTSQETFELVPKTTWLKYLVAELDLDHLKEPYLEWQDQLTDDDMRKIHTPIIAAYATQIAVEDVEKEGFTSCRQRHCLIHPSSPLNAGKNRFKPNKEGKAKKRTQDQKLKQRWIIAGEFVETQKLWARQVAYIDVQWVLPLVKHLVNYTYSEARWSQKMGAVVANRTTHLQGLVLQKINNHLYAEINAEESRDLFIRSAFVEQQLGQSRFDKSLTDFMHFNQMMIEDVEALEAKARTTSLMATDDEIYEFFNSVIPSFILDRRSFFSWWKREKKNNPELLHFDENWFLKKSDSFEKFPKSLNINGRDYSLEYKFEPGHEDDGVTLVVSENHFFELQAASLDWLVPGFITEKCETLIRGLPKSERKRFVPVPQFVSGFLSAGFSHDEPLTLCLEDFARKVTGQNIRQLPWPELSGHLKMKLKVVSAKNPKHIVLKGDDLATLRQILRGDVSQEKLRSNRALKSSELQTSELKKQESLTDKKSSRTASPKILVERILDLPDMLQASGNPVQYSTLKIETDSKVSVMHTPDMKQAEMMLYQGIQSLLLSQTNSLIKSLKKPFLQNQYVRAMVAQLGKDSHFADQSQMQDHFWQGLFKMALEKVFFTQTLPLNSEQAYGFYEARVSLFTVMEKSVKDALKIAELHKDIFTRVGFLMNKNELSRTSVEADLISHYKDLFRFDWLHLPSEQRASSWLPLVQGLANRLEKFGQRGSKDDADAQQILSLKKRLEAVELQAPSKTLDLYRRATSLQWGLQAVRTSLFSQHIKVTPKTSLKQFISELDKIEVDIRKH